VDYWINAAFSTGGFVGHLSYVLLIISMMMRDITYLRLFVIASALVGIAYDLVWLRNPVGVFWEGALLLVNLVQLYLLWRRDRSARFSTEEADFVAARLAGLSPGRCRHLLDLGRWDDLPAGAQLTAQGQPPDFLVYLAAGEASVEVDGQEVTRISPGHYIGEMSVFGDGLASADVRLLAPARVWRVEPDKIARLKEDRPTIANALQAGMAQDMRNKIVASNDGAVRARA
jgi:hypothetical protein